MMITHVATRLPILAAILALSSLGIASDITVHQAEGVAWGEGTTVITVDPFVVASGAEHQQITFAIAGENGSGNVIRYQIDSRTGHKSPTQFDELDTSYSVTIYNNDGHEQTYADLTSEQLVALQIIAEPGSDTKIYCRITIRIETKWGDDSGEYFSKLRISTSPVEQPQPGYALAGATNANLLERLKGRNIRELRPGRSRSARSPLELRNRLREGKIAGKNPRQLKNIQKARSSRAERTTSKQASKAAEAGK